MNSLKDLPKGIRAVGEKKVFGQVHNGEEKECSSNNLKVEHIVASLPPDIPIPVPKNVREEAVLDTAFSEIEQDVEETKD